MATAALNQSEPFESYNRGRLVDENMHLVRIIARQVAMNLPGHIDVNDLISVGTIGLLEAIDKFDGSRSVQFNTYASRRIRGAILDELRALDWMTRSMREKSKRLDRAYHEIEGTKGSPAEIDEVAEHLDLPIEALHALITEVRSTGSVNLENIGRLNDGEGVNILDCIKDPGAIDPSVAVKMDELGRHLTWAIKELPERERIILSLYYHDELTLNETGKVLGLTESRVCQLHRGALKRLKTKLQRLEYNFAY